MRLQAAAMLHCAIHTNVMFSAGTDCPRGDFVMRIGGIRSMKILITFAMVLALGAAAQAMPSPLEPQRIAISSDNLTIYTGPASATLEQEYFRAPQTPYAAGRVFPCTMQLRIFDKTRIAQSC
jgi:hypothetical protein